MNNTQILVTRDGHIDYTYMPQPATLLESILSYFTASFTRLVREVVLQLRMLIYDTLHGSNYRHIRNSLVKQKREAEFIASIGLKRV